MHCESRIGRSWPNGDSGYDADAAIRTHPFGGPDTVTRVNDGVGDLSAIRASIDALDGEIIALIAQRQVHVAAAGALKRGQPRDAVRAPARVDEVIRKVRERAIESGASPDVVEATYRAMIGAFINFELEVHQN